MSSDKSQVSKSTQKPSKFSHSEGVGGPGGVGAGGGGGLVLQHVRLAPHLCSPISRANGHVSNGTQIPSKVLHSVITTGVGGGGGGRA